MNPYQGCHDGVDVLRGGQHVPRDLVRDLVQLPDLVLDVDVNKQLTKGKQTAE